MMRRAHTGRSMAAARPLPALHILLVPLSGKPLLVLAQMNELAQQSLLQVLDARQDELLHELEQLNRRIEQVLQETIAWRGSTEAPPAKVAA